jgi:hypothetical protein
MPDVQFQQLLRMIEQLGLELQELSTGVNTKFDHISSSLRLCQSRCHVANQAAAEKT